MKWQEIGMFGYIGNISPAMGFDDFILLFYSIPNLLTSFVVSIQNLKGLETVLKFCGGAIKNLQKIQFEKQ